MYIAITVLIFIFAIFLILIVLVQNSKGGGLASGFSGSNQVMGVRKTTDFLEKATWSLMGAVLFLSITSSAFVNTTGEANAKQSAIKSEMENSVQVDPNLTTPNFNTEKATSNESAPSPTQEAPAAK